MSNLDTFTDSTLEAFGTTLEKVNIERNIAMQMLRDAGIKITFGELSKMAKQTMSRQCTDHKGDFEPQRPIIEAYDE